MFPIVRALTHSKQVSVPLRGVGCFSWRYYYYDTVFCVSVPLRGVGCFGLDFTGVEIDPEVSVPLRGVGCFYSRSAKDWRDYTGFRPLAGCGLFRYRLGGVTVSEVSVPWRGVGCFRGEMFAPLGRKVSVPLRGVGCFDPIVGDIVILKFPSPCGVWVVSSCSICLISLLAFPSPCGVWVVSRGGGVMTVYIAGFRPLAGCGLFLKTYMVAIQGQVSVPLRGVGCFQSITNMIIALTSFRPLAGCGLFPGVDGEWQLLAQKFPSPCGVWVVSAKLHILSGATGKRIVNSTILLYHIGRCLSIAN